MAYKKQPICNLCQAAGKKDFNHYTHDKITGKTMCPYLLTVVCKNCNKKAGHTAKYCPELKQKEKEKEKQAPQAIKHSESLKKTVPSPIEALPRSHSLTKSWANAVNHQSSSSSEKAPTKQAPTEQLHKDIPEFSLMYRCRRRACTRLVYGDSLCECVKNESCMPEEEEIIPKSKNDWFEHGQYGARLGDGLYLCGGRVVDRGPTARPIYRAPTLNSTKSSEHKNAEKAEDAEDAEDAKDAEKAEDAKDAEKAEKAEDAEKAEATHAIKINAWADDTAEWMASLDQNRKSYL